MLVGDGDLDSLRGVVQSRDLLADLLQGKPLQLEGNLREPQYVLSSASALQARSAQVDALLAGWQRGLLALQERPEAAARLLAPGVEISPEDYLATLRKLTFYSAEQSLEQLSGVPPVLAQDALRLVTTLQAVGMIKVAPDWSRLLDPEPALRLQARKGGA